LWGYSDEFMARAGADLTLTAADIERDHVTMLETGDRLVAFYRLIRQPDMALLQDLFVDPDAIGEGHGRRLFMDAAQVARGWGYRSMELDSDPNAETFYRRLGAERVGETLSLLIPGRTLPRLRYEL
jgi:GNAT superfamily N-acetyltransferase